MAKKFFEMVLSWLWLWDYDIDTDFADDDACLEKQNKKNRNGRKAA